MRGLPNLRLTLQIIRCVQINKTANTPTRDRYAAAAWFKDSHTNPTISLAHATFT